MTLPKRKVTAQIAEHRSCWTAFARRVSERPKNSDYTCETGTRGQVLGQVPGRVCRTLEYNWCNPENLRKAKKRAPRCLSAPGPILFATAAWIRCRQCLDIASSTMAPVGC